MTKSGSFRDRDEAGEQLGEALAPNYGGRPDVIVLGLPRGGVPVAAKVAQALGAPLDVFVVRKLGLPGQEELAMGAIATGGVCVLNDEIVHSGDVTPEMIRDVTECEERELRRREMAYRGHEAVPDLAGKIAIIVDDGVATGATMRAAISAVRQQHPTRLVVAVPTSPNSTCAILRAAADELIVLMTPEPFYAVGQAYEVFDQTSDDEVRRLLAQAGHHPTR